MAELKANSPGSSHFPKRGTYSTKGIKEWPWGRRQSGSISRKAQGNAKYREYKIS